MKLLWSVVLGVGLLSLTSCAAKSSSVTKKQTDKNTRSLATKSAATPSNSEASLYTCKLDSDQRVIAIEPAPAGGCQVNYEKASANNIVAEARNDMSVCGQVKDKIVQNLQQAGFQCQAEAPETQDRN